jgi:hypothetical protein
LLGTPLHASSGEMSKPKGLEFDRTQPAFLQRLRGEISGQVDDPDRHVNPVARPKGPKRLEAEEDDGPTYVMEDTNATLTKEEYEALVREDAKEANGESATPDEKSGTSDEKPKTTKKVPSIGATKKRKAAKIIGGAEEDDQAEHETPLGKAIEEIKGKGESTRKKPPPPKKKKAKVKLNFGDDEET